MASGLSLDEQLRLLQLDVDFRDRELAFRQAAEAAQQAYQRERMNLVDIPGLEATKNQIAAEYAQKAADLAFQKARFEQEFGLARDTQSWERDWRNKQLELDNQRFKLDDAIRSGQLRLDEATISGKMADGTKTLAREQWEKQSALDVAGVTGYLPGTGQWVGGANPPAGSTVPNGNEMVQMPTGEWMTRQDAHSRGWMQLPGETLERQKFGEQQRQFNINTVMNAPRGPADYAAYMNRLRGMNESGLVTGAVGNLFRGEQVAELSDAGERVPVATNTQLAGALTGLIAPPSQPPAAMSTSQQHTSSVLTDAPSGTTDYTNGTWVGGPNRPGAFSGVGANDMITLPTGEQTTRQDAYERGWDWVPSKTQSAAATATPTTNSASGNDAIRHMYGSVFSNEPVPTNIPRGSQVSYENFRNLLPSEQEYALGIAEEFGPERPEDFLTAMKRAAPDFQRSPVARSGVF